MILLSQFANHDPTRPKAMTAITKALGSRLAVAASATEELGLSSQVVTLQVIERITEMSTKPLNDRFYRQVQIWLLPLLSSSLSAR